MRISIVADADFARLAELARETFRETFAKANEADDLDSYLATLTASSLRREAAKEDAGFWAAIADDGAWLGYLKLRRKQPTYPEIPGRTPLEIERIYVLRKALGQGVGAALMRFAIAEARRREADTLWLGVWEENEHAIRFYERWGFEPVGDHDFVLGRDVQRDLLMAKRLADTDD